MGRMDEEMVTFSDLDRLRQEAEEKRQRLEEERGELQGRREGVLQAIVNVMVTPMNIDQIQQNCN